MKERYCLYLRHIGELVTCSNASGKPKTGGELLDAHAIADGAVLVAEGRIKMVGTTRAVDEYLRSRKGDAVVEREFSLPENTVVPGFVDAHTHIVFSGSREREFAMRAAGKTYMEIMNAGGGILSTLKKIRMSTQEELLAETAARAATMFAHGTTTLEIKTGYGLDLANELKSLDVIDRLSKISPCTIVATFMGAHAVPPEYRDDREAYIRLLTEEVIPAVAKRGVARFNDVFVEKGVFTAAEGRTILEAGKRHGLVPKVHADEITECGGAKLAAEVGAISADHLLMSSDEGLAAMRDRGVVAVCLPGTLYTLLSKDFVSFERMQRIGVAMALATDANPGSNMCLSMQTAINQAVCLMRTPPAAAVNMATINAAHAIGVAKERGSIEVGKFADMVILDGPSHEYLPYCYGINLARYVVKNGEINKIDTAAVKL